MVPTRRACLLLALTAAAPQCPPRPAPGTVVENPPAITATNGRVSAMLTLRSREMSEFPLKICYATEMPSGAAEAPTLRANPGDTVSVTLANRMTYIPPGMPRSAPVPQPHDPCAGGPADPTATNLSFGSLPIAPLCHQGESLLTTIESGDAPFITSFRIPAETPPGLYLYRPHAFPAATLQQRNGASGVLVVGGIETAHPEVLNIPERMLILRQQFEESDLPTSEYQLSVNFQPVAYRHRPPPSIRMRPGTHEFWRIANASADTFVAIAVKAAGSTQPLTVVSRDGAPAPAGKSAARIDLPPGGRADLIVAAPAPGAAAALINSGFDTGPAGADYPAQTLARIEVSPDAVAPPPLRPSAAPAWSPPPRLMDATPPDRTRTLYFAQAANGTNGPLRAMLVVAGAKPLPFKPEAPPAIETKTGALEEWTILNHTLEAHAFTLQGAHFVLKSDPLQLRDTIAVPAWPGNGPYPAVTIRIVFSNMGRFVAECSAARHAELGMRVIVSVAR